MTLTGMVKWFNKNKGYGFIRPDDGSKDVFIHITSLSEAQIPSLDSNQKVQYELDTYNDRIKAVNLRLLG